MLVVGGVAGFAGPQSAQASSHREAPMISGMPEYDNTDVYAFVSPDRGDSVTLVANWLPFQEPAGGPNFYKFATDARYDVNIDNDGDAMMDLTYRWTFKDAKVPSPADSFTGNGTFLYNNGKVTSLTDPNLLFRQTYDLERISYANDGSFIASTKVLSGAPVAPSYVGKASMGTPTEYKNNLRDAAVRTYGPVGKTAKSFAGQAEDPFFLDLRVFDLLYGGDFSEVGVDTLAGYNVQTVSLQVPKSEVANGTVDTNDVIGVWSDTQRMKADGTFAMVSRLGNPLVNEVVIPYHMKDRFNASVPKNDGQFAQYVLEPELPEIVEALYGIPAPATPRNDLVAAFLTGVDGINKFGAVAPSDQLRLRLQKFPGQTFNRLGVIGGDKNGFPNGRRLKDDVLDIALQVVEGKLIPGHPAAVDTLGDAVNTNDAQFSSTFPYVGVPHSGSAPKGAAASNSNASAGATFLTGGSVTPGSGGGLPLLPIGLVSVGALALLAGAALSRRSGSTVTAAA
jgi:hypothetical protein